MGVPFTRFDLGHRGTGGAFGQFFGKAALKEFGHGLALQFIAFVQECQPERIAHIAENFRILCPVDNRARAHDR